MPEVEYYVKRLDAKRTSVAKFEDGDYKQTYTQEGTADCDCPGARYHRTQCKHMKIVRAWLALEEPTGYFTTNKKGEPVFNQTQIED